MVTTRRSPGETDRTLQQREVTMIGVNHNIKLPSSIGTLYNQAGEEVDTIDNHLQLLDVQIQICRENVAGYYIMVGDTKIELDRDGDHVTIPREWEDENQRYYDGLMELLYVQSKKGSGTQTTEHEPVDWRREK